VDGHRGTIRVENAAEGGAVFTLFFPLDTDIEAQKTAELHSAWTGDAHPSTN
jgi:K+-sensing histidine kinase KdpD